MVPIDPPLLSCQLVPGCFLISKLPLPAVQLPPVATELELAGILLADSKLPFPAPQLDPPLLVPPEPAVVEVVVAPVLS